MNEHSYIRSVNRHKTKDLYYWKINDNFAGGVPDSFYEGDARDLYVEYKYIKPFPKRPVTIIDLTDTKKYLSSNQQRWLLRRHIRRGDAWVIAGCEHGGVIFRDLSWQTPISASDFLSRCLPPKELFQQIHTYCTK